MCHVWCITCHNFFLTKLWSLLEEGLLSTGPTTCSFTWYPMFFFLYQVWRVCYYFYCDTWHTMGFISGADMHTWYLMPFITTVISFCFVLNLCILNSCVLYVALSNKKTNLSGQNLSKKDFLLKSTSLDNLWKIRFLTEPLLRCCFCNECGILVWI